jgi:hypothetical protein
MILISKVGHEQQTFFCFSAALGTSHVHQCTFYCCQRHRFAIEALLCSTQYSVCLIVMYTSTAYSMHCCMSTSNSVYTDMPLCYMIHCLSYNILSFVPRMAKWSSFLRLLSNKTLYTSFPSHVCYVPLPPHFYCLVSLVVTWLWSHHEAPHYVVFNGFSVISHRPICLPQHFIFECLSLCYFQNVRDQDLYTHKTIGEVVVLYMST